MRHNRDRRKLNRTASHRKAMLRNMVTSLFDRESIRTSRAKAKEARRLAERMITFARRGDISARRHVARVVRDQAVLKKLFDEIAPRYVDRPGGYSRILGLGFRKGDGTDMVILELVGEQAEKRRKKKSRKKKRKIEIPAAPRPEKEEEAEADTEAGEEKAEETEAEEEKKTEQQEGGEESAAPEEEKNGKKGKRKEESASGEEDKSTREEEEKPAGEETGQEDEEEKKNGAGPEAG